MYLMLHILTENLNIKMHNNNFNSRNDLHQLDGQF